MVFIGHRSTGHKHERQPRLAVRVLIRRPEVEGVHHEEWDVISPLLELVLCELLPMLQEKPTIIDHDESPSFGDAYVTLRTDGLRIRIIRDKLQIQASFGPTIHPESLFDHEVVGQYLGLGTGLGFDASDEATSMRAVGNFINTFSSNLTSMFASRNYSRTMQELEALQEARANRLFFRIG